MYVGLVQTVTTQQKYPSLLGQHVEWHSTRQAQSIALESWQSQTHIETGRRNWEQHCEEGLEGPCGQKVGHDPTVSWAAASKQGVQQGKGSSCPHLLCLRKVPCGFLHPGLGLPEQEYVEQWEWIQRRTMKIIRELEHLFYEERKGTWPHSARRREGSVETWLQSSSTQRELINKREMDFFEYSLIVLEQGGMDLNWKEGGLDWGSLEFFTQNILKHWNRLLWESVDSWSLEGFKTGLNGILAVWVATLPIAGDWN